MDTRIAEMLRRAPSPMGRAALAQAAIEAVQALRQAVTDADWTAARFHAQAASAWGNQLVDLAARSGASSMAASNTASTIRRLAGGRDRGVLRRYAEVMRTAHPELAARYGESLDALAGGDIADNALLAALERSAEGAPRIPMLEESGVAALVRGLQGQVHDAFQRVVDDPVPLDAIASRAEAPLRELVDSAASFARRCQLDLFGSQTVSAASAAAAARIPELAAQTIALAPVLARAWNVAHALRSGGKGGASERVGSLAARGAGTLRELLATTAAFARIRASAGHDALPIETLVRDASRTAFEVPLPDGKNTELAHLGSVEDGKLVEVCGFVESLTVERGEKLVSRATIKDPSSGATATLAIAFTHLPHRGFVRGAYVRAHGFYRVDSSLNFHSPAVEIERLSLAKLARDGWRVRLLRMATPWFERWPNGAHMDWSVGPHRLPSGPDAEPDCGACELVFIPLTRGDD